MKTFKIGMICLSCLFLSYGNVFASEESNGKATIHFQLTSEDLFQYEVHVQGDGVLMDGGSQIRDGTMIYDMYVGEKRMFEAVPDEGYRVKEILCDREQIDIQGKNIQIAQVSGESHLEVIFEKIEIPPEEETPPNDKEDPPSNDDENPPNDKVENPSDENEKDIGDLETTQKKPGVLTGEQQTMWLWLFTLFVSSLFLSVFYKKQVTPDEEKKK